MLIFRKFKLTEKDRKLLGYKVPLLVDITTLFIKEINKNK